MVKAVFTNRSGLTDGVAEAAALNAVVDASVLRAGAAPRHVICLGAGAEMQCGVGHFTQKLSDALDGLDPGMRIDVSFTRTRGTLGEFWRALRGARTVTCNFPIVSWKRVVLRPLAALALARLRGRRVVVIQHEWDSLHWARRLTYVPALMLANRIVVFSLLVKRQLAADPVVGWLAARCVLAPLPPNIVTPAHIAESPLRQRMIAAKRDGQLIVGHFGSIYPGKQPEAVLAIGAALKARGARPLLVYIGSFIRGTDRIEETFHARAEALGIASDVVVSGFIASDAEMFGLFEQVDAFCYQLDEGLTARRASIMAAAQSGRPIVVTAPEDSHEFDHHPRFREMIDRGTITLVARDANADDYASAVLASVRTPPPDTPIDAQAWWNDTARAIYAEV